MDNSKKRVLIMSDAYQVYTGFANVARHISDYLHKTGKYDIAYLCWFHAPLNKDLVQPPFTYYTTLKNHDKCCGRGQVVMKHEPGKNPVYFQSQNGILIPQQPGPPCLAGQIVEPDKYAFGSMHGVILDYKPDVILTLGDVWMTYHTQFMDVRECYHWLSYFPIDGSPMPHMTRQGPQEIDWPKTVAAADRTFAFCDFGKDTMLATCKKYGITPQNLGVIYHGNDNENYTPVPDKKLEYRKKWLKIDDPDLFLVGFFSRNQPRKACHKLFEALSIGKKKGYWDGSNMKVYMHCPEWDVGWNLGDLLRWHDVEDIVIINKDLKVGKGPTDAEMNELYNMCDLTTCPSRGEGWGLGYSESMAAGIPTLMSAYSAHNDWAKGGAARIKVKCLDSEPITNIDRAIVDVEDYCEKLYAFKQNVPMSSFLENFGSVEGYNGKTYEVPDDQMDYPVRKYFSEWGRAVCEEHLDWGKICAKWEYWVDRANTRGLKPYPVPNIPKQVNLEDMLDKKKQDRVLYVMPGTFGDVLLSTAVVDGIKKKHPEKDIYFATQPQHKDLLKNNPNIYKVLDFNQIFMNYVVMNQLFDLTFHPNVLTQVHGNWTRNGHGDHLTKTYSDYCRVEPGEYHLETQQVDDLPQDYVVIHTKTGQPSKDWRNYNKLAQRINRPVVQVGGPKDPQVKGAKDMRGKSINETAYIIEHADLFIGGDSMPAHMAGILGTPIIELFSSTFPHLVSPVYNTENEDKLQIIEPPDRLGCEVPCHAIDCAKKRGGTCAESITVDMVLTSVVKVLGEESIKPAPPATISGYTTVYNPVGRYPWKECIKSMLGFCDEVVVVDGASKDGAYEELKVWRKEEPRLKVYRRRWKDDEPGMDGMQKAYARALCTKEFCWQQDSDEVVHEEDYDKIKAMASSFPDPILLMHLPVIDLYGNEKQVKADTGLNKWRLSKNSPKITHGIHKQARKKNKDGKIYADKSVSDGCEYIYPDSYEIVREQASYMTRELFDAQKANPEHYAELMRGHFNNLPSPWHFSWADLERRVRVNLDFWNKQWAHLDTGDETAEQNPMFPGLKSSEITEELIKAKAVELFTTKEDGSPVQTFEYTDRKPPKLMQEWLQAANLQGNTDYGTRNSDNDVQ